MAARATWKGYLKVSLVNIPVKVFPATESSAAISFNQLHSTCQTRIQQKRWCATCNREVANTELAKGYEFEKGRYVVLSEADIASVRPSSTRVINLVQFDAAGALDPMYVDRAYYLAPDGQVADPRDGGHRGARHDSFQGPARGSAAGQAGDRNLREDARSIRLPR